MANWLKEEIDQVGDRLEKAIEKAGQEIAIQRTLTKDDVEHLIRYAAEQFGAALDDRIEKARLETSELVSAKILQVREQLGEAAIEQKRVAIRNAAIAIAASILVGFVSLFYKKYIHGELDLIDVFRSVLLALATGSIAIITFKAFQRYLTAPRFKRNAVVIGISYFDLLRPKGAWGQLIALFVILLIWLILNYGQQLLSLIHN